MAMKVRSWSMSIKAVMAAILFCIRGGGREAKPWEIEPIRLSSTFEIDEITNIRFTNQLWRRIYEFEPPITNPRHESGG
jgi:hypothetical protein